MALGRYLTLALATILLAPIAFQSHADEAEDQAYACSHGSPKEVIVACDRLIASHLVTGDGLAAAWHNIGRSYMDLAQFGPAIEAFDNAIRNDPDDSIALLNRGISNRSLGHFDLAIQDLDKVISLKPDYAFGFYARGSTYKSHGQYAEAILDFNRALTISPNMPEALVERGQAYLLQDQFSQAMQDLDAAIALDPSSGLAFMSRGSVYFGLGQYARAIQDEDTAAKLLPHDGYVLFNRGSAYEKLGEYSRAIEDFDSGLALATDPHALQYRCRLLAIVGQKLDAALADCYKSIKLRPNDPDSLAARAFVYFRMKNYDDAINDASAALAFDSKNASSLYIRGLAKLRNNDAAGGHADVTAARLIDPKIAETFAGYGVKP